MNARRNALGIGVLCLLPVGALPTLLGTSKPGSIRALMPDWLEFGWALSIVLGSLIALAGIAIKDASQGVQVEAVGVAMLVAPTLLYATFALIYNGVGASLTAAVYYGLALACIGRAAQCVRSLHRARLLDAEWRRKHKR